MDHEPNKGMTRRRWLADLGYAITFRSNGWVECLIRRDNERWFGTGGDEAEAFANALHAALPSEAARVAFEIATQSVSQPQAATPVDPSSTAGAAIAITTTNPIVELNETLPAIEIGVEVEPPAETRTGRGRPSLRFAGHDRYRRIGDH